MGKKCAKEGLGLNAKKTEVIAYNLPQSHPPEDQRRQHPEGRHCPPSSPLGLMGRHVGEGHKSEEKTLAWKALNGMTKLHFFEAIVESVLL